ncbi:A24 family peptidase [Nocardia sp. NBC_01503]|uniref:A24 family peptidase n=1 Tax=Nocardia sp. NBC_01503 TaxID=2975997 RepID=UPI002E7BBBFF|nr:A24 family peptidase [Nocardia sp. NBC_01503]WTL30379.1 A24 family peptidase [Nocardia sp. NBC_01503]
MDSPALIALTLWCALLSYFDLRAHRLPNVLTLLGATVVLGYGFDTGRGTTAVLGALLLAVPYLLLHLCVPAALGAGDVKLAIGLGAATALGGAQTWVWAALAAPTLTALAGFGTLVAHTLMPSVGATRVVASPTMKLLPPRATQSANMAPLPPAEARRSALVSLPRPWDSHCPGPPIRGVATGSLGTIAHGPAMCLASVVALVAAR